MVISFLVKFKNYLKKKFIKSVFRQLRCISPYSRMYVESVSCTEVGNIVRNTCRSVFSIFILINIVFNIGGIICFEKKVEGHSFPLWSFCMSVLLYIVLPCHYCTCSMHLVCTTPPTVIFDSFKTLQMFLPCIEDVRVVWIHNPLINS